MLSHANGEMPWHRRTKLFSFPIQAFKEQGYKLGKWDLELVISVFPLYLYKRDIGPIVKLWLMYKLV